MKAAPKKQPSSFIRIKIMNSIYKIVTDKIIEKLEQGTIPWKMPWRQEVPRNFVTNIPYKGVNVLLLSMQSFEKCYWLTFRQIQTLKGWIKKGEKSTMVIFFKKMSSSTTTVVEESDDTFFLLRYYNIFNLDQVELPDEVLKKRESLQTNSKIMTAEEIIKGYPKPPAIVINSSIPNPRYLPRIDRVEIQPISHFDSSDNYYASLFHELIHSTGSADRLIRKGIIDPIHFGSENYGKEELIAEIGASFLCSMSGIENTIDLQASYIQNWLQALKNDSKLIILASSHASKAVDFIIKNSSTNQSEEV
jgi:antirestriction protein ArdC